MTTYTGYDSDDLEGITKFPKLVGETHSNTGAGARKALTINSTKIYKPTLGRKPIVIVQYTMGSNDFTIDSAYLELYPCYEAQDDITPDGDSANFVFGVEKFDLTRGLMGETDQDIRFLYSLQAKPSPRPASSLHLTDTYVRVWQVSEMWPAEVPIALRLHIDAVNDSAGTVTTRMGMWVVGIEK